MHTLRTLWKQVAASLFAVAWFAVALAQTTPAPTESSTSAKKPEGSTLFVLPTYTVNDKDTGGYLGNNSLSATAAAIPVTDLPISITVLTRDLIEDTGTFQLMDLTKFISSAQTFDRPYDDSESVTVRGYNTSTATDGAQTLGELTRDMATVARVEVVKGPSAILFPRGGSAGATVNVITKTPQEKAGGYLKIQAGQYNSNRIEADYNTPLADGKLLFRTVVVVQDADGYAESDYVKRTIIFPALTYKFTEDNTFTIKYQYWNQRSTSPTGQGLGPHGEDDLAHPYFDFSLPRDRSFDDPELNEYTKKEDRIWATLNAKLSDNVALQLGGVATLTDDERLFTRPRTLSSTTPLIAADGTVERIISAPHWHRYQYRAFWDNTAVFSLLGSNHTLVVGAEYTSQNGRVKSPPGINFASTNAFAPPQGGHANPVPNVPWVPETMTELTKLYIMDIAKFWQDRITLNFGMTRNFFQTESFVSSNPTANGNNNTFNEFSKTQDVKQYGALFQPVKNVFLYGSYSENYIISTGYLGIIDPATGVVTQGPRAPSRFNKNTEFGMKLRLMGGRLSLNLAHYSVSQTNRTTAILGSPYAMFVGAGTSKGWEADAFYAVNDNLSLLGTVGFLKARNADGTRFVDIPDFVATGWLRYDFRAGSLKGLGLAAGVSHSGDQQNINRGVRFTYDGRTIFDFAAYYDWKPFKFQLNVTNVFNEDYYAGGSPPTISYRGQARNIMGAVTYSF